MKITKKQIKEMKPREEGWKWYLKNQEEDLLTLLLKVNSDKTAIDKKGDFKGAAWALWVLENLLKGSKTLSVKLAVFSADLVISNFEKEYPDDDRPSAAIEAAKNWLRHQNEAARSAMSTAVPARYVAEYTNKEKKEIQEKIILEAVRLLEKGK